MTERDAYIALNLLPRIGPIRVQQFREQTGSAAAILAASPAALARISGVGPKLAEVLSNWQRYADPAEELQACEQAGVQIITLADPEYPELLKTIHDPPMCLYVRGQLRALAELDDRGLAVVGSRRTTNYGMAMADKLAGGAVATGWTVVSGLARGIDTVAHRATLKHGGTTIAVIAGGLRHITPPENLELAVEIAETGCLISEQPLRMAPDKRMFPMRNRLIAGLCRGTLVVEAGLNSGSLITAELALEQGRAVFAVPGRVDQPHAGGCHRLIKQGAKLVETFDDVLDEFQHLPGFERPRRRRDQDEAQPDLFVTPQEPAAVADLPPTEQAILRLLMQGDMQVDEILAAVEHPPPAILAALLTLEMKRLVKQLPGRRYRKGI